MNIIVKMVHGSHLYGLNTEHSDMDYKGVFLPSLSEIVQLNPQHEIRQSTGSDTKKNTSKDVDTNFYSLQKFLKMACDGETIAIDMLFAPDEMILESSEIWEEIRKHRHLLLTKNMKTFLGYCKRQAAKYGVRGSRLDAIEQTIKYLKKKQKPFTDRLDDDPMIEFGFEGLAVAYPEYIKVVDGFDKGGKWIDKKVLQVCESKYDFTCKLFYVIDQLQKKYDSYGERAKQAKENKGIDWKAISHALRAGYQLKEIYETGNLVYPLKKADFLLQVKKGELDYTTVVAPTLEMLIDEVELLASKSNFPESVDRSFWYNFIQDVYDVELDKEY